MVPADSDRIPRVPPYSGGRLYQLRCPYQTVTVYGVTFQTLPVPSPIFMPAPTTPALPRQHRFGLFPFRSPLLRKSIFLSLPAGTKMFQFPALTRTLCVCSLQLHGLPHSDICGSKPVCSSPQLFAAYHVLLRHLKPEASSVRSCSLRYLSYSLFLNYVLFYK